MLEWKCEQITASTTLCNTTAPFLEYNIMGLSIIMFLISFFIVLFMMKRI